MAPGKGGRITINGGGTICPGAGAVADGAFVVVLADVDDGTGD